MLGLFVFLVIKILQTLKIIEIIEIIEIVDFAQSLISIYGSITQTLLATNW